MTLDTAMEFVLSAKGLSNSGGGDRQLETYSIECADVADAIARLATLMRRHSVEIQNLSTWCSLKPGGALGLVVTLRRPTNLSEEALVKRMNNIVGVIRVRREMFEENTRHQYLTIEVSATGHYVDKLATLGYEFKATALQHSQRRTVMQLSDTSERIEEFLKRLGQCIDYKATGEIRVSPYGQALTLLGRKRARV
ncbi:acetolactate synthase small subunit [Rhodococcus sp. 27YEA15]|uniref:hypothetical protein n=1 Tax=Rhodococcus sp. 27YEA15 TaxID=3156259 RepID=UPI003C7D364A